MDPLFCYTSGRWLWSEREQLEARFRYFNISSLKQAACQVVGAIMCVSLEKIGDGNYNKAYRLVMEDGQRVIAKISHPNSGPEMLTTASEVATIDFVRTVLGLPVPNVLAWSATNQGPVEAEYIIMEEAKGSQLHEVWSDLHVRIKRDIIHRMVDIEKRLLSISFQNNLPRCEPAVLTTGSREVTNFVQSRFCIGPIVKKEFWVKERSKLHKHHGPWNTSTEYLESVARREIDWITTYAKPNNTNNIPWQFSSAKQTIKEAHVALLQKFISAIPHIVPQDEELLSHRLWHPDFHAGNLYVDEQAQISCIIDWQGAWTTPVFIGANPPALLDYGVDMLMKLPDNFKQLDDATKDQLRYQVSQSILIHSYETLTAEENPLMYKMMRHSRGKTLKQLDAFAGATWDNCLYPFQECLINVENEWDHFGADEPCPYHFTAEEVKQHREEAEFFNNNQELWDNAREVLTDEGYTSNETFSEAVKILVNLRESGLADLTGEERSEFDRETQWMAELGKNSM
ncbi:kinase-like domain-containing protein [Phaeosphaeriaceae sp. PMI808]|nr:kinase-like domain-containing protein [Phaeosphaeriaceae sp. PMI808]